MACYESRTEWLDQNEKLFKRRGIFVERSQLEVCYDRLKSFERFSMPEYIDRRLLSSQLWERIFAEEDATTGLSLVDWKSEIERLGVVNHEANKWASQLDSLGSFSQTEKMAMYQMLTDSEFYRLAPPDSILVSKFLRGETFSPHMEPARLSSVASARQKSIQV